MDDSEDKTGPQKHGDTTTPAQDQPTPIVPTPSQHGPNENRQHTTQQEHHSQPPRKRGIVQLQTSSLVPQDLWNGIVAIFTIFLSIVTYWQYQLGGETLRFTQMNERPWISAELHITNPFVFDEKGNLGVKITMAVKNVGKTVAQESWAWADLVFLDPDGGDIAAQQRQIEVCNTIRDPTGPSKDDPGFALFPEVEPVRLSVQAGKWANEIAPELARALPANKGKVGFAIIGCVSYRAAAEDSSHWRHQTRFLYYIGLWDEEAKKPDTFMNPRTGPYKIVLIPKRYGNSAD